MVNKVSDILEVISKRGQNPVYGTMYHMMANWKSWYRGDVNDFHRYNVKTINGRVSQRQRLSLQMAKKVCEDWTTLLFNEEVEINIKDNDALNDALQKILEENNFRLETSALIERTFALGTGAFVEFINDGEVMIDYINGENIIVTAYRNQKINGIVAINSFDLGDEIVTHLTFHDYNKGNYTIENKAYSNKDDSRLGRAIPLQTIFGAQAPAEIIVFETEAPHFQIIKPNVVNNYELENPLGVSIFANSIDTLMAIDRTFDSFLNEYEAARHRIIVDADITKQHMTLTDGGDVQFINYFDTDQMEYQSAPMGGDESIKFYNAPIRAQEHIDGLNRLLQTFGFKCGLGTDYYAFDSRGVYQNEKAIISEHSDLWASKSKHEVYLKKAFRGMMKALAFLYDGTVLEDDDIEVTLADSIIIDDEAQYTKELELVDRSALSMFRFLMKWYGMTEEEAKQQIAEATEFDSTDELFAEEGSDNPMPKPNPDESMEEFMARFMSDATMMAEYPDEEQRYAVGQSAYGS